MTYVPDVVVYHYPCQDGISAAATVFRYYPMQQDHIEFVRGNYAEKVDTDALIEQFRDKNVLMVDYTYKPEVLEAIKGSVRSLVIIDHHDTAQRVLADHAHSVNNLTIKTVEAKAAEYKTVALFDMDECGTSLVYKFFYPDREALPPYIERVKDIDLGRQKLPDAEAFKYWSRAQRLDVVAVAKYLEAGEQEVARMLESGRAMFAYVQNRIEQIVADPSSGKIGDLVFPYAISDYAFASDIANAFVQQGHKMGICLYFTPTTFGASLRSRPDFDCNGIAEAFGGGGHKQAAGFNLPIDDFNEFIDSITYKLPQES